MNTENYDVIIIGAGAAGMMCAIHAGRRGRRVLILNNSETIGSKILIAGGGHCNFTNTGASPAQYVSRNPYFCTSSLTRFPPERVIQMVHDHGIAFHEKKLGQLFCDGSAKKIVNMLKSECDQIHAQFILGCKVLRISSLSPGAAGGARFMVETAGRGFTSASLVIATGGLSIPKSGATGFGYEIARQFGINIINPMPALDGFTLADAETRPLNELAGISVDCTVTCNGISFRENILFTHTGLSGPAALQASLYWNKRDEIAINLLPDVDCFEWLLQKRQAGSRALIKNLLAELLPSRFAKYFCERYWSAHAQIPLPQISMSLLRSISERVHHWTLVPTGTVGYGKAEVTRGGVDTAELSSKTMEAKKVPGLYFIGEVTDVTGWLGGYNFQWAWASGWAAGQVV